MERSIWIISECTLDSVNSIRELRIYVIITATYVQNHKIMRLNQWCIIQVMINQNMQMTWHWFAYEKWPIQVRVALPIESMLIKLDPKIKTYIFEGFISPLCLPLGSYETSDQNLAEKTGIVAGWGVSTLGLLSHNFVLLNNPFDRLTFLSHKS